MKIAIIAAALLLGLAGHAAAQPSAFPAAPASEQPPVRATPGEPRSEKLALAISLGGTVASWGLVLGADHMTSGSQSSRIMFTFGAAGAILAPSVGHWYAGGAITRGLGLRAGGLLVGLAGVGMVITDELHFPDESWHESWMTPVGKALAVVGVVAFAAGTIDDIVTAPGRARRQNRERAGFAIAPIVTQRSAGLALGGQF
jgi:hypothetical protein